VSGRVFVHIGLPKTGTSYLQAILWGNRDRLRDAGLLLPGREKRDHLLASMIVRDDPGIARRGAGAAEAWDVVRAQAAEFAGDALVSHEFFCAADADQAARMVDQLAPAEVHLVVTAREPLGLFTSSWQEHLKNKGTTRLEDYGRTVSDDPRDVWDWRALDLGLVLGRWGGTVPPERVHVIPVPGAGAPHDELWRRLCRVLGTDPDGVDLSTSFPNRGMGVVEAETLRRVNEQLTGRWSAYDRGRWLRSFLADQRLVPRDGERFWPAEDQVADCRERAERAVRLVAESSYDVVGDLDSLLVPGDLPPRRHPSSVTDAEVAEVAVNLVATLLGDVRDRSTLRPTDGPEPPPVRRSVGRLWRQVTGR
jgi:hypothetical protein